MFSSIYSKIALLLVITSSSHIDVFDLSNTAKKHNTLSSYYNNDYRDIINNNLKKLAFFTPLFVIVMSFTSIELSSIQQIEKSMS